LRSMSEVAQKKDIRLEVKIASNQKVFADTNMLHAIICNLASNAIKFTQQNETITISARPDGIENVRISVKDNGIGMSKEMLDNLFILGVDSRRRGTDGEPSTGLGLLLCKEFVEKHEGHLWAESQAGKGSTFNFTIPGKLLPEVESSDDLVDSDIGISNQIKKLKVLIAEDDNTSEMLIRIAIGNLSDIVIIAANGADAVEACQNNPDIDLVLMDIKMPGIDGYEATRLIRQFNKDVVIIAQTAFGQPGEREKAIESGCNDYISKPMDIGVLTSLIYKHVKKSDSIK